MRTFAFGWANVGQMICLMIPRRLFPSDGCVARGFERYGDFPATILPELTPRSECCIILGVTAHRLWAVLLIVAGVHNRRLPEEIRG